MSTKDTKIINESESHLKVTRAHRKNRTGTTRRIVHPSLGVSSTVEMSSPGPSGPQSVASSKTAASSRPGKLLDGSVSVSAADVTGSERDLSDDMLVPYGLHEFHELGDGPDGSLIFSSSSSDSTEMQKPCQRPPRNLIEYIRQQLRLLYDMLPTKWTVYTHIRNNVLIGFVFSGLLYYPLAILSSSLSAINRTLFGGLKRMLLALPVLELVKQFKEEAGPALIDEDAERECENKEKRRMQRRRLGHLMIQAERLKARKNALKRALLEEEGQMRRQRQPVMKGFTPSEYNDVFSESEDDIIVAPPPRENRARYSRILGGIDKELRHLRQEIEEANGQAMY